MTTDATGHDAEDTPRPSREEAVERALEEWERREVELGKEQMRAMRLWDGKAQRQDKVLLTLIVLLPLLMVLTIPLRPLLIADHPVPLAFATGGYAAIGSGGAFAGIGQGSLWLVVLAGVVGKTKANWLFWWLGHRWGIRFVRFVAPSDRAQRFAERLRTMSPWVLRVLIPLSYVPGVPGGVVCVLAGTSGMRLRTYLVLDALGALAVTAAVACVGYTSGQAGVDVVMLIDRYALWIMLALILGLALYPAFVAVRDQRARRAEAVGRAEAEYDEETARLEAERADGGTRGE
jgi:membrane protein DedA with SNARE-associated domain